MLLGLFVIVIGLAGLFFMFNTGQLVREKTKLVNTADAVAYSGGLLEARALNFDAYSNRALVANEVFIAQLVTLSSWMQYFSTHVNNMGSVFPECYIPPYGYTAVVLASAAALKFGPIYAPICFIITYYIQPDAGEEISDAADYVKDYGNYVVKIVEANKTVLQGAGRVLHAPAYFEYFRGQIMQEVADANYVNDGKVTVEPVFYSYMTDNWNSFVTRYDGNDRDRMKQVVTTAAYSDPFLKSRSWNAVALSPEPSCMSIGKLVFNQVKRRGGTELVGFDEWKAEDTESYHWYHLETRKLRPPTCKSEETSLAYGAQMAAKNEADDAGASYGGSASTNPKGHDNAASSSGQWSAYTGLPGFYDLSKSDLGKSTSPTMKLAVRLSRARDQLMTSDGRSQIQGGPNSRLNTYNSAVANDEMAAVSSSEVFFQRPGGYEDNSYGAKQGKPVELGSLFNPYWQVHLIETAPSDIAKARGVQGVILP